MNVFIFLETKGGNSNFSKVMTVIFVHTLKEDRKSHCKILSKIKN